MPTEAYRPSLRAVRLLIRFAGERRRQVWQRNPVRVAYGVDRVAELAAAAAGFLGGLVAFVAGIFLESFLRWGGWGIALTILLMLAGSIGSGLVVAKMLGSLRGVRGKMYEAGYARLTEAQRGEAHSLLMVETMAALSDPTLRGRDHLAKLEGSVPVVPKSRRRI